MKTSQPTPRREFLRWSGMAAGALILSPVLPKIQPSIPETEFDGVIIRGTGDGKILASSDDGVSWMQWMNFGGMIEVIHLQSRYGQLTATLRLGQHEFQVRSDNGRTWRT